MIDVTLKKGKEKAAMLRHPWIFSGAIDKIKGKPANGEVVTVRSAEKEFLAYAYYNDQSRVALRLLEWDEAIAIDKSWYEQKLKSAIAARAHVLNDDTNTCRLVFSEADFLPGLIVDKYADFPASSGSNGCTTTRRALAMGTATHPTVGPRGMTELPSRTDVRSLALHREPRMGGALDTNGEVEATRSSSPRSDRGPGT